MSKGKITSQKRRDRQSRRNNLLLPLLAILGGIVLLLWGGYTLWDSSQSNSVKVPIEVTGSPSLKADQELVDLGDVKLNKTVTVSFQLSNVGDKTLRFSDQPYIEVLEGC